MELYETNKHYVIINRSIALFCDRLNGQIFFGESIDLAREWNPVCLGQIKGVIGKIKLFPDGESKLIVINRTRSVGQLPVIGHVHRVTKISIIPLNARSISNLDLNFCKRHPLSPARSEQSTASHANSPRPPLFKTFQKHVKTAAESVKPRRKDVRDRDKFEKRMLQEFHKMFQDSAQATDSLYACCDTETSFDITSTIQRQKGEKYTISNPLWRRVNDRFFWNKTILQDAIESAEKLLVEKFGKCIFQTLNEQSVENVVMARTMIRDIEGMLIPIIQGFVQVEPFSLHTPTHSPINSSKNVPNLPFADTKHEYQLNICLISRRSRHRAGTRFRRRGVDCNGNAANYVETEQILLVEHDQSSHIVSFVQVRGSVPIFWSQFSPKYRPPIIIEKSDYENQAAFRLHFSGELESYDKVIVVNLVDSGAEKPERKLSDEYLHHIVKLNSPMISCVMFDFHDYCRGLQFDNVSILMKGVTEIFRNMRYTWVDKNGMICEQKSIFRVNCVDCLDRTNVVQCMFAGVVIETQLRKLGLLSPEHSLPANFFQVMQLMWANNGDAISRQYSGTAAMKGDFTRTRRRTMNGLVKDGVSSVNRYYLRLREITRQAALDLITGNHDSAEIISLRKGRSNMEQKFLKQKKENIKELTIRCKEVCLRSHRECMTESILVYSTEDEKEFDDMNSVALISSKTLYFVCNLIPLPRSRLELLQKRQPFAISLPLRRIYRIQLGYEPMLFRPNQPMMRIYYDPPMLATERMHSKKPCLTDGNFLTFKQPRLRLFNNLLIEVEKDLDVAESLKAVAQSFYLATKSLNPNVHFDETITKFDRLKLEAVPNEWIYHINANFIYDKIVPSSELKYVYDDIMSLGEYGSMEKNVTDPAGDVNFDFSYTRDKTQKCQSDNLRDHLDALNVDPGKEGVKSECCYQDGVKKVEEGPRVGDTILASCGLVSSSLARLEWQEGVSGPPDWGEQLAAATGDAYQRRAERISLKLSVEPRQLTPCLLESPLLSLDDRIDLDDEFTEITSANAENSLEMPPIEVTSSKVAERLAQKQIDMALFVERLRRKLLPPGEPVLTQMIIF